VRTPLAEYRRECGYLMLEASSPGDARTLLEDGSRRIDIVLAEVKSGEPSGFGRHTAFLEYIHDWIGDSGYYYDPRLLLRSPLLAG
jgi:hypothetical protein